MAADVTNLHPAVRYWMEYALDWFQLLSGGRYVGGRIVGGTRPTVTSGFRSAGKQAELYASRDRNPYPVNRPGDSAHQYGLAFDSSFAADVKPQLMPLWVQVRRAVGFRVPDNDEVHAEVNGWREIVGRS